MKLFRIFPIVFLFLSQQLPLSAQHHEGQILIPTNAFTRVGEPIVYRQRKALGKPALATITINQWTGNPPDSAKIAVQKAVDIWSHLISSSQTIKINAHWTIFQDTTEKRRILAWAVPDSSFELDLGVKGKLWYTVALAEMLSGQNLNGNNAEIDITINAEQSWYYGTDGNTPANTVDLETVILHELVHGFGFTGSADYRADTTNVNGYYIIKNQGLWEANQDILGQYIYDNYMVDDKGTSLADEVYHYTNALGDAFVSDKLFFDGSKAFWIKNSRPKLYAPTAWEEGSSLYHLDQKTYDYSVDKENSLMTPYRYYAQSIHSPGPLTLAMLEDLGWINAGRIIAISSPLGGSIFQKGALINVQWTDNKSGNVNVNLVVRNLSGGYEMTASGGQAFSNIGSNSYSFSISNALADGRYKIQIEDGYDQGIIYGESNEFIITGSSTGPGEQIVGKPTFDPLPGNYPKGQQLSVQISSSTQDADIYYTLDGTDPNISSTRQKYTGGIPVSSDMVIIAMAQEANCITSDTAVARYTFGRYIAPPIVNPPSGKYVEGTPIVLSMPSSNPSGTYCCATMNSLTINGKTGFPSDPNSNYAPPWNYPSTPMWRDTIWIKFRNYSPADDKWSDVVSRKYFIVSGLRIDQVDKDQTPFGGWAEREGNIWMVNTLPNASVVPPPRDTIYQLLAQQDFKKNTTQKYHWWDRKAGGNSSTYLLNHADIPVKSADYGNSILAEFLQAENATVQSQLIEASNVVGGTLQFADPWLNDSTDQYSTPINRGIGANCNSVVDSANNVGINTKYKGVHLNQSGLNAGWAPPYYSVSAPQTQSIGNFTGYFMGWTGTNVAFQNAGALQTAVVFQAPNAVAAAQYKGHLCSNTSQATANNSSRNVAYSSNSSVTHAVYCSTGSIWYVRNVGGTGWSNEIKLGDGKNPSIAITTPPTSSISYANAIVHVVWEQNGRVYYRRSINDGVTWDSTLSFQGKEASGYDATPIVIGKYEVMVIWRYGSQDNGGGLYACVEPAGLNIRGAISVTNCKTHSPSGVEQNWHYDPNQIPPDLGLNHFFHVAYATDTAIIYDNLDVCTSPPSIFSTCKISISPSPATGNTNPSIACDLADTSSRKVGIAWENSTNHRVYYRESANDGKTWGSTVKEFTYGTYQLSHPSIAFDLIGEYLLFQCSDHIGETIKNLSGGSWSPVTSLGAGTGASLSPFTDDSPTAVWTTGTAAPYSINFNRLSTLPAPALTSPADGKINCPTTQTLNWASVTGGTSYHVQVSSDPSFNTSFIVKDTIVVSALSLNVSGMQNGKKYFWHVRTINSTDSSAWSDVRSITTNLPVPVLASPSNKSKNIALATTFKWKPISGTSFYQIQISLDSLFGRLVFDSSFIKDTSKQVTGLLNDSTYYWRVRGFSAKDTTIIATSNWSKFFSFTTVPPVPSVPVLLTPIDSMDQVSLSCTFIWNQCDRSQSYMLQLARNTLFDSTSRMKQYTLNTPDTSKPVTGLSYDTLYYWRVKASNTGGSSDWSKTFLFRTLDKPPKAPITISPNFESNMSSPVTLVWHKTDSALTYQVQLSTAKTFDSTASGFVNVLTADTTRIIKNLADSTQYYWRVRGKNLGGFGAWSTICTFMTKPPVPTNQPVLLSPVDSSIHIVSPVVFRWIRPRGATSCRLMYSTDSTFTLITPKVISYSKADTSKPLSLSPNVYYYWRVKGINGGGEGPWSDAFRFKTAPTKPPTRVVLVSPINKAIQVSVSPSFVWRTTYSAESYQLQLSLNSLFDSTAAGFINVLTSDTTQKITGLAEATRYCWRARAINFVGAGQWSLVRLFTTGSLLRAPVLSSPPNDTNDLYLPITLNWNHVNGATYYNVAVATDSLLTDIVYNNFYVTDTSVVADGLKYNTTYYWSVWASNEIIFVCDMKPGDKQNRTAPLSKRDLKGNSGKIQGTMPKTMDDNSIMQSAVWSFTTANPVLSPPNLSYPADQSVGPTEPIILSWDPVQYAFSYKFIVATDPSLTNEVYSSNTSSTEFQLPALSYNTTYYWSVWASFDEISSEFYVIKPGDKPKLLPQPISLNVKELGANINSHRHTKVKLMGSGDVQSAVWSFTTTSTPPNAPILVSPLDSATNVSVNPTLSWNPDSGATSYNVIVATDSTLTNPVYANSGITTDSVSVDGLENNTSYYWNVSAIIDTTTAQGMMAMTKYNKVKDKKQSIPKISLSVHESIKKKSSNTGGKAKIAGLINSTSPVWRFNTVSGLSKKRSLASLGSIIPEKYSLLQNYPNPGNPSTQIRFDIPEATKVRLTVYDVLGRIVKVLMDRDLKAGSYVITWDGRDEQNHHVATGLYFYQMCTNKFNNSKKLLMIK